MSIDYRYFKDENDPSKAVEKRDEDRPSVQWWKEKGDPDLAAAIWAQIQTLQKADMARVQLYKTNSMLYGNEGSPVSALGQTPMPNVNRAGVRDRIAFNLIQSCADTLTSKISKNKPKPFFLTSKGDSKIQRKAKNLDQFCVGVFYENKSDFVMPRQFRDGCVWGDGIQHVYNRFGRVAWERVLPWELLVDYLEALAGPEFAKTMHRVKYIDRETLRRWQPDHASDIDRLPSVSDMLPSAMRSISDTVAVAESWRLPSEPGGDDGLHCISVPGLILRNEPYERARFPFSIFRYSPRLHGFWGQGLSEQLTPIQVELNRCLMTVQRSFHLGGSFKILLHASSQIVKSHLDNTIGSIIQWAGEVPPQYVTPPMVPPEIYQQIQNLIVMGYRQSGISELSAGSQKPVGIDSGKGLRTAVDIETDRFQTVGQAYEAVALELADLSIETAKEIDGDYRVKVPQKRFLMALDWKDVDMEKDEYVMQCFPVSKLPSTPEGRLETIQEMMQAGLIDPDTGRRLLDYPDLDEQETLANAQLDYLHDILDKIVEDGELTLPEPDDGLTAALKLAVEYLAVGKRDNLEEGRRQMLRDFIAEVNRLMTLAQPPQMAAPGGAPQAVPEAPPTSNILPNAPAA